MRLLRPVPDRAEPDGQEALSAPSQELIATEGASAKVRVDAVLAEAIRQIGGLGVATDRATTRIRAVVDARLTGRPQAAPATDLATSVLERLEAWAREARELELVLARGRAGLTATAGRTKRAGDDH